ncbi:MAG TPA: hypothetical protein VLJ42_05215 [Solirubrobacteraceae bacterium]|nr:hypothetical protein [Solirubrobacteraceae bacterium]
MADIDSIKNDTYTTDGVQYRTPAHPLMIAALGRALWNFLSVEEQACAILNEVGTTTLAAARALTAGEKERRLRRALGELRQRGAPQTLLASFDQGIKDYCVARRRYRNGLAHAGLFTSGYDPDGTYKPGISLEPKGQQKIVIAEAPDLHAIAIEIEDLSSGLGQARRQIIEFLAQ